MQRKAAPTAKRAGTRANPRALAARVVEAVAVQARYLDAALTETLDALPRSQARDAALVQEMSYGTLRWFDQLAAVSTLFLDKPLKPKDQDVYALLLVGLYQLLFMRVARHAAVQETVEAANALKKPWARNLLNACLRAALREEARVQAAIAARPEAAFSHPAWLLKEIKHHWPDNWAAILVANNERPPMVLRVNRLRQSRDQYLARLALAGIAASAHPLSETAVVLASPMAVTELPGFAAGDVSVQDAAAQLAAPLLDARAGERVLDACAAPGGKTGHLLEQAALAELVALDREPARLKLIEENLARLKLHAKTVIGDAANPASWWDGQGFDRVLADVPCSATGVIRRHPDIKVRRRPEDLSRLVATQEQILDGLWPLLKPGGKLLYATCSILPAENENQMTAFLRRHPDATEDVLTTEAGRARAVGRQILPGEAGMDGFYYARLRKN
ncbi:16S rRNA methyltransferase [Sulfuricaulis limicola]|uniref:16S rRNA (cytosine(967)-C(5))-methyltransferase n=1 Tax=Sulfuricaulis limicola TaxID=1620215 RepID=A0A1B4XC43_9GAMM|nr:16S rRNA (cytosine(967)-C(5))-methyltransferase RsmB [Sulfuricaulis limicola]BAV32351.1 16S rRNA methyltransferase [Sulfuricaulis limicola]